MWGETQGGEFATGRNHCNSNLKTTKRNDRNDKKIVSAVQDSLTAQSPKCKTIRCFAGWFGVLFWSFSMVFVVSVFQWFCFGRLVSSFQVLVRILNIHVRV